MLAAIGVVVTLVVCVLAGLGFVHLLEAYFGWVAS